MDINRANMDAFFETLNTRFTEGFQGGRQTVIQNGVCMIVPSSGAATRHGWLNQVPGMREWLGDRIVNNIETNKLVVTNRDWEETLEVARNDIEDDEYGLYAPLAQAMGDAAGSYPDEVAVTRLIAGTSDTWGGDGAAFFGTDRTYGANTIANYVTSTFDAEGTALNTAYQTMRAYKGHNGRPLGVIVDKLLHGPTLRTRVHNVLKSEYQYIADIRVNNPNLNLVEPVESPLLVGDYQYYWFLLAHMGPIRGILFQERKVPEMQNACAGIDSEYVFNTNKFKYGAFARGEVVLALPHLVYAGLASS